VDRQVAGRPLCRPGVASWRPSSGRVGAGSGPQRATGSPLRAGLRLPSNQQEQQACTVPAQHRPSRSRRPPTMSEQSALPKPSKHWQAPSEHMPLPEQKLRSAQSVAGPCIWLPRHTPQHSMGATGRYMPAAQDGAERCVSLRRSLQLGRQARAGRCRARHERRAGQARRAPACVRRQEAKPHSRRWVCCAPHSLLCARSQSHLRGVGWGGVGWGGVGWGATAWWPGSACQPHQPRPAAEPRPGQHPITSHNSPAARAAHTPPTCPAPTGRRC
jgi:hypothetical protein